MWGRALTGLLPFRTGGVWAPHAVPNPQPQPHPLYVRSKWRVRTITPDAMVNASLLRNPGGGKSGRSRLKALSHRRGCESDTVPLSYVALVAVVATLGGKPMAFAVALNFSAVLPFALKAAFWKLSAISFQPRTRS